MTTALLLGLGIAVAEPRPEVPPPPPLSVTFQDDAEASSLWGRLEARLTEPVADPFDARGQTDQKPAPIDPALVPILQRWSEFNEPKPRLRVRTQMFVYDRTFGTVIRSKGRFICDNDSSRVDLYPAHISPDEEANSKYRDRYGHPFRNVTAKPESYIKKGTSLTVVDHDQETYVDFDKPPLGLDSHSVYIVSPFRTFRVDQRTSSFSISPGSQHQSKGRAHLRFEGLSAAWREHYASVEVMIDLDSGCALAMRITPRWSDKQIVYVFDDVAHGDRHELWDGNAFEFDRSNYTDLSGDLRVGGRPR